MTWRSVQVQMNYEAAYFINDNSVQIILGGKSYNWLSQLPIVETGFRKKKFIAFENSRYDIQ